MQRVTRVSISIEEGLIEKFDAISLDQGTPTRSEAIKNLIRSALIQKEWEDGEEIAATITLVYDHHKQGMLQKLVDVQHDFNDLVICSQHAHLNHHNCIESIIVQGNGKQIRDFYKSLTAIKGIKHTALNTATTGQEIE